MSGSLNSRLARLEGRWAPSSAARVDRVMELLERVETGAPGSTAEVIREAGLAGRLPSVVAESEAHAATHAAGAPCVQCDPFADPVKGA